MAASVLQLSYCEGAVPLSVLAAASLAGVEVAAKVNPKLPKGSQPVLALPNRWVFISQHIDALTQETLSNYAVTLVLQEQEWRNRGHSVHSPLLCPNCC